MGGLHLVKLALGARPGELAFSAAFTASLLFVAFLLQQTASRGVHLILSLLTATVVTVHCLELVPYYFQGQSFSPAFFYHLSTDTLLYVDLYPSALVLLFGILALWGVLEARSFVQARSPAAPGRGKVLAALALVSVGTVMHSAEYAFVTGLGREHLRDDIALSPEETRALAQSGVDLERLVARRRLRATTTGQPHNLVLVYAESLEQLFFDEIRFPGLLPFLSRLKQVSRDYTRVQQVPDAGWTIGGMAASQCGLPITVLSGNAGNDVLSFETTERFSCLGDVLARAGYFQAFLQGASLQFARTGSFFADHRYDLIVGRENLRPLAQSSPDTFWGYSDERLFGVADKLLGDLRTKQPFNLTLATIDTHPPGYPSSGCPRYGASEDPLLQAAHCTDHLLAGLYRRLESYGLLSHTTLVVVSDHLMMTRFHDAPDRRLTFFVVGPHPPAQIDAPGTHFDVAPTVLDSLGITTDAYFPLGSVLRIGRSKPPTLDPMLLSALRKALRKSMGLRLDCGTQVVFDAPAGRVRLGDRDIWLSFDNGKEGWPGDRFLAVRAVDGVVVSSGLMRKEELLDPELDRTGTWLLAGSLRQLEPAQFRGVDWGYYWGDLVSFAGPMGSLPREARSTLVLCRDAAAMRGGGS